MKTVLMILVVILCADLVYARGIEETNHRIEERQKINRRKENKRKTEEKARKAAEKTKEEAERKAKEESRGCAHCLGGETDLEHVGLPPQAVHPSADPPVRGVHPGADPPIRGVRRGREGVLRRDQEPAAWKPTPLLGLTGWKAVSFGVSVGTGIGYINLSNSEHLHPNLEIDYRHLYVLPGIAFAPFHIAPELNFHITNDWHLSVLMRIQIVNAISSHLDSPTSILGELRFKRYFGSGSLRFYLAFGAGAGQIRYRMPYGDYDNYEKTPNDVVDTRVAGLGCVSVGGGLTGWFSPYVGFTAETNTRLLALPAFAVHQDFNVGLVFAFANQRSRVDRIHGIAESREITISEDSTSSCAHSLCSNWWSPMFGWGSAAIFTAVPTGILYWKGYSEPDKNKQYIAHISAVISGTIFAIAISYFAKWLSE